MNAPARLPVSASMDKQQRRSSNLPVRDKNPEQIDFRCYFDLWFCPHFGSNWVLAVSFT